MTTPTLELVDPKKLVIAANVRIDTKLTTEFVASIKAHGVKVPIEVERTVDGLNVIDGQRRTLAAIQAGIKEVPVVITAHELEEDVRIVDQLVLNDQRESLSNSERSNAMKQLALIGIDAGEIAKRTSTPKATIEKAIAVAGSEAAAAALHDHEITLDQAAELIDFAGDKKVLAELTQAAVQRSSNFPYLVKEARKKMALAASKKELAAKLKAAGVPTVPSADYEYYRSDRVGSRLEDLVDDAGKKVSMTAHKKCPGHAAYITAPYYSEKAEIVYVCTDYAANGHQKKNPGVELTAEEIAEREERDRQRAELEEKRQLSTELRHQFIVQLLQLDLRKTAGVDEVIAETFIGATREYDNRNYYSRRDNAALVASWLGIPLADAGNYQMEELGKKLLEGRTRWSRILAFGVAIASLENLIESENEWLAASIIFYLNQLQVWGHNLTDYENRLRNTAQQRIDDVAQREAEKAAKAAAAATDEEDAA